MSRLDVAQVAVGSGGKKRKESPVVRSQHGSSKRVRAEGRAARPAKGASKTSKGAQGSEPRNTRKHQILSSTCSRTVILIKHRISPGRAA